MKKNTKVFISGALVSLAVAASAFALKENRYFNVSAEQQNLSVTWDASKKTSSTYATTKTANGNDVTIYGSNLITTGDEDIMFYLRGNGAGIYFSSTNYAFQAISSISITYMPGASGGLTLYFGNDLSNMYNGESHSMKLGDSNFSKQTNEFQPTDPSNANFFTIWSTSDSAIYSITVNYLCE